MTVSRVSVGSAEQPVDIHLVEFPGKPFKPSKSMRRVLVASWGPETEVYVGRKMTLYGDPTVRFGGQVVGGIKISHLSHIDKPLKIALTVTRGKREPHTVQPLVESAPTRSSLKDAGANMGPGIGDPMSADQQKLIGVLFGKLGYTDATKQLAYVSEVLDRTVTDASQISRYEASRVIDYLKRDEEKMTKFGGEGE